MHWKHLEVSLREQKVRVVIVATSIGSTLCMVTQDPLTQQLVVCQMETVNIKLTSEQVASDMTQCR